MTAASQVIWSSYSCPLGTFVRFFQIYPCTNAANGVIKLKAYDFLQVVLTTDWKTTTLLSRDSKVDSVCPIIVDKSKVDSVCPITDDKSTSGWQACHYSHWWIIGLTGLVIVIVVSWSFTGSMSPWPLTCLVWLSPRHHNHVAITVSP